LKEKEISPRKSPLHGHSVNKNPKQFETFKINSGSFVDAYSSIDSQGGRRNNRRFKTLSKNNGSNIFDQFSSREADSKRGKYKSQLSLNPNTNSSRRGDKSNRQAFDKLDGHEKRDNSNDKIDKKRGSVLRKNEFVSQTSTMKKNIHVLENNSTILNKHTGNSTRFAYKDQIHEIKKIYNHKKLEEVLSRFKRANPEDNYEKLSKSHLYKKLVSVNTIKSYINVNTDKQLKDDILKLKNFLIGQLIHLDRVLIELKTGKGFIPFEVNLFETFEYTIIKPFVYIANIIKETEMLIPGKYNYDFFHLLCYFLKVAFLLYSIPSLAKNNELYDINDEISQKSLKLIYQSLDVVVKQTKINYFQFEVLHDLFNRIVGILYSNDQASSHGQDSSYEGNSKNLSIVLGKNDTPSSQDTKYSVMYLDIYNKYKEDLTETSSDDLSLIMMFDLTDELFNHGAEVITYLLKNQKFTFEDDEIDEILSRKIPVNFVDKKESNKKKKKAKANVDVKTSKLRLFNYLSYQSTLCMRSSKNYQSEFIGIGFQGVMHAAYLVNNMVEKLFIILYENSKKVHKDFAMKDRNLFMFRLIKLSLDYLLSSSENFNQQIQTMYISVTDLYSKLAFNLIKIIYLIEDLELYDENIKEIAEEYTDILLNLFMNTNKENSGKLYKEKNAAPEKEETLVNRGKVDASSREKNEKSPHAKDIKSFSASKSIFNESTLRKDYARKSTNVGVNKTNSTSGPKKKNSVNKFEGKGSSKNSPNIKQMNATQLGGKEDIASGKKELVLLENNVLVNLFYRLRDILQIKTIDKILNLKLLKTYTNLMKLASTLITLEKGLTQEFRKIFQPKSMLEFLTISIKLIYLKYGKNFDFDRDKFFEYQTQINQVNILKFNQSSYKDLKVQYYDNTHIYEDELFKLCCDIYIFMNWLNVNGDLETRKLFKYLDEEPSSSIEVGKEAVVNVKEIKKTAPGKKTIGSQEDETNYFDEWFNRNKILKTLKKVKSNLTQEENTYALKFFNDLLKSIDINSEVIKSEKIVLEDSRDFEQVIANLSDKSAEADNDIDIQGGASPISPSNVQRKSGDTKESYFLGLSKNKIVSSSHIVPKKANHGLTNEIDGGLLSLIKEKSDKNKRGSLANYKITTFNSVSKSPINSKNTQILHGKAFKDNKDGKDKDRDNISLKTLNEKEEEYEEEEKVDKKEQSKLKKVYFIENPLINLISEKKLHDYFEGTERHSWIVKVSSILTLYKEVLHEILFNTGLKERSLFLYYTLNLEYSKGEIASFIMIMVINFVSLLFFSQDSLIERKTLNYVLLGIGAFLLSLNSLQLFVYMTSRYRYLVDFEKQKLEDDRLTENKDSNNFNSMIKIYFVNTILFNSTPMFFIANIVLGIIALLGPKTTYCYTILLLFYSKFSKVANMIIYAFKSGVTQMFFMIIFLMIIIWTMALFCFDFLHKEYNLTVKKDLGDNWGEENICQSTNQCFISFMNYGVRNDGGIGDIMPKRTFEEDIGGYYARFFIDFIFFVIVILLFLNMINGIIINTFSQLREIQETKKFDVENNCFICNLDKSTFQKKKINFNTHVNKQHGIKDYLLFLINVTLKPEKDLDPDETRVIEAVKKNDVSFFPCEKALDWDWTLVEKIKDKEED